MQKKDRNIWTNKFRELGKKKGSRKDFVDLYKEMKKFKEENKQDEQTEKQTHQNISGNKKNWWKLW